MKDDAFFLQARAQQGREKSLRYLLELWTWGAMLISGSAAFNLGARIAIVLPDDELASLRLWGTSVAAADREGTVQKQGKRALGARGNRMRFTRPNYGMRNPTFAMNTTLRFVGGIYN